MNANEFGARSMRRIATSRDELLGVRSLGMLLVASRAALSQSGLVRPAARRPRPRGAIRVHSHHPRFNLFQADDGARNWNGRFPPSARMTTWD